MSVGDLPDKCEDKIAEIQKGGTVRDLSAINFIDSIDDDHHRQGFHLLISLIWGDTNWISRKSEPTMIVCCQTNS